MWLFELLLVSVVGGAILGVGWRLVDDYLEKRQAEKRNQ
jgi:hypothetical protein